MTDDELDEFMDLMRVYRSQGRLPPVQRKRFRSLAKQYQEMVEKDDNREAGGE